jgi:galactokinase
MKIKLKPVHTDKATEKKKEPCAIAQKTGAVVKKTFTNMISHTKKHIRNFKPKCKKLVIEAAYAAAKDLASDLSGPLPRVIPLPKTGGFLPLIPILAGLSATGSLAGGIAGITKAINNYKSAKKQLAELKRHNMKMEGMCIGKGLHLKPYKRGLGIYVTNKKN